MALYWRNKTYESLGVANLPRVVDFDDCPAHPKIYVNYALVNEVQQSYNSVVEESAKLGDNVGLDEFSEEDLEIWKSFTEIFIVRDNSTSELLAFISITPSPYSRSFDSLTAQLFIFRTFSVINDDVLYRRLLRLTEQFVVDIGLQYTAATINMSWSCGNLLSILRQEGFNITAIIPRCVLMAPGVLQPSAILVKQLVSGDREPRSLEEIQRACKKTTQPEQFEKEYRAMSLPSLSLLPLTYTFKCGIQVRCRILQKDEDTVVFSMMQRASSRGEGYARYEHPGLNELRKYVLSAHPCVVYENMANNEFMGFSILGDSWFSRTSSVRAGQTDCILKEHYRGMGIGKEIVALEIAIMKELKYEVGLNDALVSNNRMLSIVNKQGFLLLGTFPKAAYDPNTNTWIDIVLEYIDLVQDRKFKSLADLLQENKQNSKL